MDSKPAGRLRGTLSFLGGFGFFCLHAGAVLLSVAAPITILVQSVWWVLHQPGGPGQFFVEVWPRWLLLLGNSGRVALPAVLIAVGGGAVLGFLLFKTDMIGRAHAAALLLLAAMFPLYVTGGAMLGVFRRDQWLGSTHLAGVIHGLAHLPLAALVIGLSLRLIPLDYEELAMLEGAGPLKTVRRVTLRLAMPGILGAVLLVTLWTWTDYSITDVLAVRTFAEEVYTQFALNPRSYEPAMIMWPQLLLLGLLLWLFRRELLGVGWSDLAYAQGRVFRLGAWRRTVSALAAAFVLAGVLLPVGFLAWRVRSFREVASMLRLFEPEIRVSAVTSLLAGVACGIAAMGLAWQATRHRAWRAVMGLYIAFMLAFPAPLLGIGLIRLLNRDGLPGMVYDSPLMLVIAYAARFLPVAVVLTVPFVRAVPVECELAARVDGCGTAGVWWRIVWPTCWPAAVGVAFAVAALSLGELPCSLLVTPPGYVTVTTRFFSLIHYGLYADSAALCLLSIAGVALPWMGLMWILRRRYLG